MTYFEIKNLKDLLNCYIKDTVEYDKKDIMYKMDKDIIEKLSIIVSRNLPDGESIENIIRKKLYFRVEELIDSIIKFSLKRGDYINPNDLKKAIKKNLYLKLK